MDGNNPSLIGRVPVLCTFSSAELSEVVEEVNLVNLI